MRQVARLREKLSSKESTINDLSRTLGNKEVELEASTECCSRLTTKVSSLQRDLHRFKMRDNRADEVCSRAVERAVDRTRKRFEEANTKRIKRPDGRIEDWVRNLVVELVALDKVPTAKVPQVIERVRCCFVPKGSGDAHDDRVECGDQKQTISDRSVRRIMVESYVKAFLRAAALLIVQKAWTASGDGTSCKGANIGSRFATFPPIPFDQNMPGVMLDNWLTLLNDITAVYNDSPSGHKNPITVDDTVRKVTGYSGDHAADQKKLAKELCAQKREAILRVRGKEMMSLKSSEEVEKVMVEKLLDVVDGMDGWEEWEKLPEEDQLRFLKRLVEDTERYFGELYLAEIGRAHV